MKNKFKLRGAIVLLLVFAILPSSISYGTGATANPQIQSRGLVFNTGVSSDQIRLIKDFFRAISYQDVPWGYSYDARTKELVRHYQKSKGLTADGIAGQATINAMNKDIADKKLDIGLRVPYTNVKGEMLLINKSSNTIYLLKDGQIQVSYPVATGKTTSLTPNGKFKVANKYQNPRWGGAGISAPIAGGASNNPLGKRWIGISHKGGGTYGVHGNANARSIGTYASLGCVRMFNQDVEKLYERVKTGIPIWIGPENILENYGVQFKYNTPARPKEPQPKPVDVNIELNGELLKLDNPVLNKEGTTYYPFREILEFIGAGVAWDGENRKVTGSLNEKFVTFQLDNIQYVDSSGNQSLPKGKAAFSLEGKTYVPIRNLMESLGYSVIWEPATNTVKCTLSL